MPDLLVGAAAGLVCGLAGLAMPRMIARLPEPAPLSAEAATDLPTAEPLGRGAEPAAGRAPATADSPKQSYVDLAARPRLGAWLGGVGVVAGALIGARLGPSWSLLLVLPLVPLGASLAVVDLRCRLLPSAVINPATVAAALYVVLDAVVGERWAGLERAAFGFVIGYGFFRLLHRIRRAGMGGGDVRLAGLLGLVLGFLGWGPLLVGLYLPFLLFGVPGVIWALVRWDRALLQTTYAFGPFLLVGALVGVLVSP